MKCIKNGSTIKRVDDKTASARVADGWKYTSKEEWKKATRKETPKVEVVADDKTEKAHGLKAKDRKKSNRKK